MSDDERIARLTELARRLWHHDEEQPVTVQRGLRGSDPATAFVRTANGVVLDIAAPNDRALDALEAALLVLVSEPSPLEIAKNMIHEGLVECSELKQRIAELEAQLAGVLALADKWEADAAFFEEIAAHGAYSELIIAALLDVTHQLRERVKGC